jgi:uncharacterized iron-regulated membrane protein
MKAREFVLRIHRWTGLTAGIAFIFVAVTGLTMVFRPQLEPLVDAPLRHVSSCAQRISLDEQVSSARARHPAGAIRQVEVSQAGLGATVVRFADLQGYFVDPCNGAVLGEQHRWGGFFNTVEQLHRWRFIDNVDVAETIAGSVALLLALAMVVGGLTVWWPSSRRQWKSAFKLKLRLKGAAFEINLHRTLGTYAAVILLATTLAAQTFTFDWARQLVFAVTGSPAPAKKPASGAASGAMQPMERFLTQTLATVPTARDVTLLYPRKPGDSVEASVIERDAPHPNAKTLVNFDAYTGEVLRFQPSAASSAGNKVYRWLASLHMGYIGGLPGQVMLFLSVLAVPVLGYTGIRSYLRRRVPVPESKFRRQTA